jgi:hypothetical protein
MTPRRGRRACNARVRVSLDGDKVADGERLLKDRHAGSVAMIEAKIRPSPSC